jgi:REP element-mobilizing transposase RayT
MCDIRRSSDSLDGTRRVLGTSGHGCGGGFLDEESIPVQLRGADAGCTRNRDIRDFAIAMCSMDCYALTMRRQCGFEFRTWGGTRKGGRAQAGGGAPAGSPPATRAGEPAASDAGYDEGDARRGAAADGPDVRAIGDAMAMASKWMYEDEAFRIVHASVQGNHLHLLVEADSNRVLSRAMKGFLVSCAKRLNAIAGRSGRVFADRFHAASLPTPRQVRNALAYVLAYASHCTSLSMEKSDPIAVGDPRL